MREDREVLAYFVTFTRYGTWLHGDARDSNFQRRPGEVLHLDPNPARLRYAQQRLAHDPMTLDASRREVVDAAIREACEFKGWYLPALNVRTNHVHLVVAAEIHPDRVVPTVKARATFRLRERRLTAPGEPVWTEGASTHWLWTEDEVSSCCAYVLEGQGPDLA
ncbi:MAG: transposase [Dehalococcoidia bacterium]